MAAPVKKGIDYFTHDVGMITDRKLKPVKIKYGAVGLALWLLLIEMIYGDKGYYISYDDNLVWEIIDNLGADPPDYDTACDIISLLVKSGLFDKELFDKNILTSRRIQKQFIQATARRKNVTVDRDIWLLSADELKEDYNSHPIITFLEKADNVDINSQNVDNNPQNVSNNPDKRYNNQQSRVEKSRVEKIRADESRVEKIRADEKRAEYVCQPCADSIPPPPLPSPPPIEESSFSQALPEYINKGTSIVKLTLSEYNELCRDYKMKDIDSYIQKMDMYLTSKGKTYSDYKTALLKWMIDDKVEKKSAHSYDMEEIERYSFIHTPKLKKKEKGDKDLQ